MAITSKNPGRRVRKGSRNQCYIAGVFKKDYEVLNSENTANREEPASPVAEAIDYEAGSFE
jgi:hypothetical protein